MNMFLLVLLSAIAPAKAWSSCWGNGCKQGGAPAPSYGGGAPAPSYGAPAPSSGAPAPSSGGGGGKCKKPIGWKCNKNWYIGSTAGDDFAKDSTMWGNVHRCMHDAEFIKWDSTMAAATMNYIKGKGSNPPHSPVSTRKDQGENKWFATRHYYPAKANAWWYDEYKTRCGGVVTDGCKNKGAPHFTAMVWNAATKLGCARNSAHAIFCRYGGKCGHCSANWDWQGEDCYPNNVFEKKHDKGFCETEVEKCFGEELKNKEWATPEFNRLNSEDMPSEEPAARPFSWIMAGMVCLVSLGLIGLAAFKLRKRRNLTIEESDQELVMEESLE